MFYLLVEEGKRSIGVTALQTCALPSCPNRIQAAHWIAADLWPALDRDRPLSNGQPGSDSDHLRRHGPFRKRENGRASCRESGPITGIPMTITKRTTSYTSHMRWKTSIL